MSEPGYATQTTTTTVTSSAARPYFDISYIKTWPAWIKIAIIVLDIIATICVGSNYPTSSGSWFQFVSIVGFIVHTALLVLYLFHVPGVFSNIKWYLIEGVYCAVWAFLFFTACIAVAVLAARYSNLPGYGAGAFFGFVAMILYAFDAFVKFRAWRRGDRPQVAVVSQSAASTTVTSTHTGVTPGAPGMQDPKY